MNIAELIVRDVCETDPADPTHEESVIVNVKTLERLIEARIGANVSDTATRLRRVARLAGCADAVPDDDATAVGCIASVLGIIASHLGKRSDC